MGGKFTAALETGRKAKEIEKLAHHVHSDQDLAAPIASGSFRTAGMIVAPCSMKTLSGIAHSYADNLVVRAAELGAVIAPPTPAFYGAPKTIDDLVNHSVGRVLDLFDIESGLVRRWQGARKR